MIALLLAVSFTMPPEVVAFKQKLAPAPIERKAVDTLFNRLVKDGAYERSEGDRTIAVELIEVGVPEPEGMVRDLLYRRAFSHMEAHEQTVKGDTIDAWQYDIGLDGKLDAARHIIMKVDSEGRPLEQGSQLYRLSPSDASVQARWKKLSGELLKLGKTYSI